MRKYLLAAVAAAAISSPSVAQDVGPYVGLEGGYIVKADTEFDLTIDDDEFDDALDINYKNGYDIDGIAGYDFGAFRAEAELGYKRLKVDSFRVNDDLIDDLGGDPDIDGDFTPDELELRDRLSILSGMVNVLFDLGSGTGLSFYGGGGAGLARVKAFDEKDTSLAWQLIAGLRAPVSENVDVGLKYRFFNVSPDLDSADDGPGFDSDGRFSSHSVLASLIFKLGAAPRVPAYVAPAPVAVMPLPAPAPVATQVCYDGSVIPVTNICPVPPQAPRAGERG